MSTKIYDKNITNRLWSGVEKTAKLVGETFGPLGNNVILADPNGTKVTKDGITVLKNIVFEDEQENIAAMVLREASDLTNSQTGDGTTGTCVLAAEIFKNGLKQLAFDGINSNRMEIRKGIKKAAGWISAYLSVMSKKITKDNGVWNVAYISSNHSKEIADVLAEIFLKIGENGTIRVEEGNGVVTTSKIVEGMQFAQGYVSPYFATNTKLEAILENPYIFLYNKRITSIQDILGPLQEVMPAVKAGDRSILIIADDIDPDPLSTVIYNRLRGTPICVVRSPSYGDNRKFVMSDIAVLTGGKVISEETGIVPSEITVGNGVVGLAKQVIVTRDNCTIIGGCGNPDAIAARVAELKEQLANAGTEYDNRKLSERLAKLTDGIGVISVGANTELELKEKKYLVDDAFCACKAALAGGIVPGGGLALHIAKFAFLKALESGLDDVKYDSPAMLLGMKIVAEACDAPMKRILENAGCSYDVVIDKISKQVSEDESDYIGYDVMSGNYVPMYKEGIIDSTEAIRSEIENAASVAGVLLTTAGAIIHTPEKKTGIPSPEEYAAMMQG